MVLKIKGATLIGHIPRHNSLFSKIIVGTKERNNVSGRQSLHYISQIV